MLSLELPKGKSALLRGPRKVGKSYWVATHLSGVLVNYVNIARETGIFHKVVRTYFDRRSGWETLHRLPRKPDAPFAGGIEAIPWQQFVERLWSNEFIAL